MSGEYIVFLVLALFSVMGGTLMLISKKVMHMMVAMIFTFISIAGIFILLSAEFLAAVQVMVYSGAVSIMMIFGIMLTNHKDETRQKAPLFRRIMVGLALIAFATSMYVGITHLNISVTDVALHENNTEKIGMSLYSDFIIPFEISSLVLLVSLVGAIIIARKDHSEGGGK
ncbi:MAG: NADH:ubiquinone oxidoreductase subunit [Bacillales bacterium]|jgi:NADH-quinone oxidoreductase subunit J|nr:NADH:ubiquinone oxidoreductase subunit [Bacillales bacterium]